MVTGNSFSTGSTRKRLRRERSICSCKSPRLSHKSSPRSFNFYELDVWTEIAKFLDGKSLVKLALTCRWFHGVIMQDCVWKFACLSHLQVPAPDRTEFKWIQLYASAIGKFLATPIQFSASVVANHGSHSYAFRDKEKHLDWMRIGAFFLESPSVILSQRLTLPLKIMKRESLQNMLGSAGACLLSGLRTGIWIADLQLVRCPVCELDTCEGTMQALDARHIELFLSEEYQNCSWEYEQIGSHKLKGPAKAASATIMDLKHITDRPTADVFNLKLWAGRQNDFQPKAMITFHAVAISTNLQANQGLLSKFYVMRAGTGGEIVSIRVTQQLL
ncbi:unnamed protein product [Linum trigynum]|uniref:F-box domain-containing protein n=1 Tax=Linum trigynum TaxID=586398 RepID=A0AAV2FW43_9ROSI